MDEPAQEPFPVGSKSDGPNSLTATQVEQLSIEGGDMGAPPPGEHQIKHLICGVSEKGRRIETLDDQISRASTDSSGNDAAVRNAAAHCSLSTPAKWTYFQNRLVISQK